MYTIKIRNFWKWFAENSSDLSAETIPETLVSELEERLFAIERLDWEIGPGQKAPNLFALSPRIRRDLRMTRGIIALAPQLVDWEFHAAKPPRTWNLVFSITVNNTQVEIDGKLWEFVAYKFKNGTYDLLFKPDDAKGLSNDYLLWAATIIVDGEIGEEARMEKIPNIKVISSWDEEAAQFARNLDIGLLGQVIGNQ